MNNVSLGWVHDFINENDPCFDVPFTEKLSTATELKIGSKSPQIFEKLDDFPDRHHKTKKLLNTIENLQHLLIKKDIEVRYNVITKDVEIKNYENLYGPIDGGKNAAISAIISECARAGLPISNTPAYIDALARKNPYNPVADLICNYPLSPGGGYITELCDTIKVVPGFPEELKSILIKKWLISAVALAFNPGNEWSKGVLVFQGAQNIGKTSWFSRLLPKGFKHLFKEGLILKPDNKDSVTSAIRHWIVELGELDGTFNKSELAQLKAFFTSSKDVIRLPYDRKEEFYDRRTVFCASVNEKEFLKDHTGNSRFWTIPVVEIDYRHNVNMFYVWAEATARYIGYEKAVLKDLTPKEILIKYAQRPELLEFIRDAYTRAVDYRNVKDVHYLTNDESNMLDRFNEDQRQIHPIEEKIIESILPISLEHPRATATEVLKHIGYLKPTQLETRIAANVLRKLVGDQIKSNGRRVFCLDKYSSDLSDK